MTGTSYDADGASSGNVQNVTGITGTIVDAMSLDYIYDTGPDSYVDEISATEGVLLFQSQDSNGRVVCYTGPTDNYRTINSSVVFGALRDAGSTKNELMAVYMDFLTEELTGITEGPALQGQAVLSVANPCRGSMDAVLALQEPLNVRVAVFDSAGRLVGGQNENLYSAGTHSLSVSSEVENLAAGTYMLVVTAGDETLSRKFVILN